MFHWFAAGQLERGLDMLFTQFRALGDTTDVFASLHISAWELGRLFQRALAAAHVLQRPPRDIYELQRWLASFAVASEDAYYFQVADAWRERMRQDSGLAIWEQLSDVADPGERLTRALITAFERFNNTPEAERVCRPDEAIRHLVHFVAISIAISFRTYDTPLVASLPGLLEPFAPLSPAVSAIYQNAYASRQARAWLQPERARERWLQVYESLAKLSEAELPYVGIVRGAIAAGVGVMEAHLGLESTARWAELVENDPMQAVQGFYLRKVVCLQLGDWAAADEFRKRAEHLSLQSRVRPMFNSTLLIELAVHARAGDLTGVKQLQDRIALFAANSRYWPAGLLLASGLYKRLCGLPEDACRDFEACLALTEPDAADPTRVVPFWLPAVAGYLETLIDLGRHEQARTLGRQVLERCREREIEAAAFEVQRTLALAEGKCGDFAEADARLNRVIEAQKKLGVTGLIIGVMYEARARIAIWARDEDALIEYGALTSREYRRRPGSALGACYERLMDEARLAFPHRLAAFAKLDLSVVGARTEQVLPARVVSQVLRQATTAQERATFALSLLCEDCSALGGYLYLVSKRGLVLAAGKASRKRVPRSCDSLNRPSKRSSKTWTSRLSSRIRSASRASLCCMKPRAARCVRWR